MSDYTFKKIVADRDLADRCLAHMGQADFQEVLNDCHSAARALMAAMDEIQRLQVRERDGFGRTPFALSPVRNEGTTIGPDDPLHYDFRRTKP